jgi:N,N'-diacetyllegionaminate synthase
MLKKKLPYIIAEVGSNHLGNQKLCFDSITQAKKSGADCVKFQIFDENNLVNKKLKIYKHVKDKKLKFQYQRFKKVKVTVDQVKKLYKFAKKKKIDFAVSPFDVSYVSKLKNFVDFFKVASGDINNLDLLHAISKTKKKVVLSTGMSNQKEIKRALQFFSQKRVAILHCMSSYPTKFTNANLINISYLKKKYNVTTGYSDHVPGINASINAAILGAEIIEKHFMPKKTKLAGDYSLSVDKFELTQMITQIKDSLEMKGKIRTKVFKCEEYSKKTLRRSLYFSNNLSKGHKIKKDNLMSLRPYINQSVKVEDLKIIVGSILKSDVKKHQLVKHKDVWLKKNLFV